MRPSAAAVALTSLWWAARAAASFSFLPTVNFTTCLAEQIQNSPQDCSVTSGQTCVWHDGVLVNPNCTDTATQVCVYNDGVLSNPGRIFLTLPGCMQQCGDGWGFWGIDDVLFHISTWLIPALVLVFHFHFPPLGWWNVGVVAAHVLGDPIDSLWSLLTRIAIHRQLYNLAVARRLRSARAIATIWAAYDELNFHDPSGFFLLHLQIRRGSAPELAHFLEVAGLHGWQPSRNPTLPPQPQLYTQSPGPVHQYGVAPERQRRGQESSLSTLQGWLLRMVRPAARQDVLNREDEAFFDLLSPTERQVIYLIERAAQRLVQNRSSSSLETWLSVIGLVGALIGAYVRTMMNRIENQTAHTVALVTLLFVVVPIVKLSSNLGAFTSTTAAVDIIQELRQELPEGWALFPELKIGTSAPPGGLGPVGEHWMPKFPQVEEVQLLAPSINDQGVATPSPGPRGELERRQLEIWPRIAAYSGMISSYRPRKISEQSGPAHATAMLVISLALVSGVCYTPALLISYKAPLPGFACRSLAWTLVLALWIFSAGADLALALFSDPRNWRRVLPVRWRWIEDGKNLWLAVSYKDMVVTSIICVLALAQLIGLYNNCWCRGGGLTHETPSYVNLNPLTDAEWAEGWHYWITAPCLSLITITAFILSTELLVSDSGYLLNRGRRDRDEMALHVRRLVPA